MVNSDNINILKNISKKRLVYKIIFPYISILDLFWNKRNAKDKGDFIIPNINSGEFNNI